MQEQVPGLDGPPVGGRAAACTQQEGRERGASARPIPHLSLALLISFFSRTSLTNCEPFLAMVAMSLVASWGQGSGGGRLSTGGRQGGQPRSSPFPSCLDGIDGLQLLREDVLAGQEGRLGVVHQQDGLGLVIPKVVIYLAQPDDTAE